MKQLRDNKSKTIKKTRNNGDKRMTRQKQKTKS